MWKFCLKRKVGGINSHHKVTSREGPPSVLWSNVSIAQWDSVVLQQWKHHELPLIDLALFWIFDPFQCTPHSLQKTPPSIQKSGASQVTLMVKNLSASAGDLRDMGSIPGLGKSPRGEHGNPLQHSCQEKSMDRRAWRATVHRMAKSQIQLKQLSTHTFKSLVQRQKAGDLIQCVACD